MSLTDPIPDYYHTRNEDDYDYLFPDQDSLDEAYDFYRMEEVEVEEQVDKLIEKAKDE